MGVETDESLPVFGEYPAGKGAEICGFTDVERSRRLFSDEVDFFEKRSFKDGFFARCSCGAMVFGDGAGDSDGEFPTCSEMDEEKLDNKGMDRLLTATGAGLGETGKLTGPEMGIGSLIMGRLSV